MRISGITPDVSRTNEIEADIANKYVATMA